MTGEELYTKLSQRDFSGNEADEYAQFLQTVFCHIQDGIYPLLEKAEADGKRLDIASESVEHDEIVLDDLILV